MYTAASNWVRIYVLHYTPLLVHVLKNGVEYIVIILTLFTSVETYFQFFFFFFFLNNTDVQ